jgi:hypothetical protein
MSNAKEHLLVAEPNAYAALNNSPAERCSEVRAEPKPGDRDGDGYADAVDKCPADAEVWNTFQDHFGEGGTDGDWQWVVYSRLLNVGTPVRSVVVRANPGTIRRRRQGVGA